MPHPAIIGCGEAGEEAGWTGDCPAAFPPPSLPAPFFFTPWHFPALVPLTLPVGLLLQTASQAPPSCPSGRPCLRPLPQGYSPFLSLTCHETVRIREGSRAGRWRRAGNGRGTGGRQAWAGRGGGRPRNVTDSDLALSSLLFCISLYLSSQEGWTVSSMTASPGGWRLLGKALLPFPRHETLPLLPGHLVPVVGSLAFPPLQPHSPPLPWSGGVGVELS